MLPPWESPVALGMQGRCLETQTQRQLCWTLSPWVSQSCKEIKHKPPPPWKKHLHKPCLKYRKRARHRSKLSHRGCASRRTPGGEKSQADLCVGWVFQLLCCFLLNSQVKKPQRKQIELTKSQQPTGASCPTAHELIWDVCTAGRTRAQNHVLLTPGMNHSHFSYSAIPCILTSSWSRPAFNPGQPPGSSYLPKQGQINWTKNSNRNLERKITYFQWKEPQQRTQMCWLFPAL